MGIASFSAGFAVGFGTGFVSRELFPIMKEIMRPIIKTSVKSAVKIYERSREALARFGEVLEDSVAEVKQELKDDHEGKKERGVKKQKKLENVMEEVPQTTEGESEEEETATVTPITEIRGAV